MSVDAQRRQWRALQADQDEAENERFIDLCLVWERPNGSTLWVAGGQWDRVEKKYTDREPEFGKIYRLTEAQVEAAEALVWWMQERKAGRPRDFITLQLMGERGAGKTNIGAMAMPTLLLTFPHFDGKPAIGWQVSKAHTERDELDREIADNIPAAWFKYVDFPFHRYRFANGATLTNVSADDPENTKKGRVDFLLVNEIQKVGKRGYLNALARISDKGGFSILTGNWPSDRRGQWIYDLDDKRKAYEAEKKSFPIHLVKMAAKGNSTRDVETASQVATIMRELDPRLAAVDLDGLQMPVTNVAYWEWDKARNLKRPPDSDGNSIIRNITQEITSRRAGRRAGFQYVIGGDFQRNAHMVATVHKIFGSMQEPLVWAVDEVMVDGIEEDLIDALMAAGYTPENSLIVGDGSGRHQDGAHTKGSNLPTGRNSFNVFRRATYYITGPVRQQNYEHRPRNPLFDDRCRLHNWGLKNSRYFVDPVGCPTLAEGLAKCELGEGRYGQGRPRGEFSHITDSAGYVFWWTYPDAAKRPEGGKRLYEALPELMRKKALFG